MVTWLLFFWDGLGGPVTTPTQPAIAARLRARAKVAQLSDRANAVVLPARANVAQLDRHEA
jgi:hypothetical protein